MVGTSAAMRIAYAGEPPEKIPRGLWCYRIDPRRVIIGGALSDGGGLYAWLRRTLSLTENDRIEKEISKRSPAAHGLKSREAHSQPNWMWPPTTGPFRSDSLSPKRCTPLVMR